MSAYTLYICVVCDVEGVVSIHATNLRDGGVCECWQRCGMANYELVCGACGRGGSDVALLAMSLCTKKSVRGIRASSVMNPSAVSVSLWVAKRRRAPQLQTGTTISKANHPMYRVHRSVHPSTKRRLYCAEREASGRDSSNALLYYHQQLAVLTCQTFLPKEDQCEENTERSAPNGVHQEQRAERPEVEVRETEVPWPLVLGRSRHCNNGYVVAQVGWGWRRGHCESSTANHHHLNGVLHERPMTSP